MRVETLCHKTPLDGQAAPGRAGYDQNLMGGRMVGKWILAFLLFALPAFATKIQTALAPAASGCEEWDGFMTQVFGSDANTMTALARAYCTTYPLDAIDVTACNGKS